MTQKYLTNQLRLSLGYGHRPTISDGDSLSLPMCKSRALTVRTFFVVTHLFYTGWPICYGYH